MNTWREFLAMGGYGLYVWSAYGLSAILLLGNLVAALRRERRVIREIARELSRPGVVGQIHDTP